VEDVDDLTGLGGVVCFSVCVGHGCGCEMAWFGRDDVEVGRGCRVGDYF
jgi:hypothetical protein